MVGRTLGLYLSRRFAAAIVSVFGFVFALIYLIDFVELLRRASGLGDITTPVLALLSLLRAPAISENVLPFAILAGSMVAFLSLSRTLELVVARAAGVSVWQFLAPPILIAFAVGLFAVGVFNPLSAVLKQRADRLETRLFRGAQADVDTSLWLRQRSSQGPSILHAERSSDGGQHLSGVTAYLYETNGAFKARVEAAEADLKSGFWQMTEARVTAPGQEPHDASTYRLPTNLSPEQVTQSFVAPDTVSFWALLDFAQRSEAAGLDGNRYRLQWQVLLARPMLFIAMVLIAAAFSLRFFRFGGLGRTVTGGVIAGFVLYVATKLVGDLGGAGLLSAPVAAWSPAVLGSLLGTLVLLHQEDG